MIAKTLFIKRILVILHVLFYSSIHLVYFYAFYAISWLYCIKVFNWGACILNCHIITNEIAMVALERFTGPKPLTHHGAKHTLGKSVFHGFRRQKRDLLWKSGKCVVLCAVRRDAEAFFPLPLTHNSFSDSGRH